MVTVPEIVQKIIRSTPLLEECLAKDLINYSAFARVYKKQIQEELMKPVQEGAVVMALKRLSTTIKPAKKAASIFEVAPEMMVRSSLFEVTVKHLSALTLIKKLGALGDMRENYFLTLTQGVFESTIIASTSLEKQIVKSLPKEYIVSTIGNLSAITIKLPKSNVTTPGVYYTLMKCLAWENVNIIEVVSTTNEFTLIVKTENINHAFVLLKNVFNN